MTVRTGSCLCGARAYDIEADVRYFDERSR
jgi:hypothetical protein